MIRTYKPDVPLACIYIPLQRSPLTCPSICPHLLVCRSGVQWQRRVKRGVHTLKQPEFQIMHVAPGLAAVGSQEWEDNKVVRASERFN